MFVVTTPAANFALLDTNELRAAIGVADSSKDAALAIIGSRVTAIITDACRVARTGLSEPTLYQETITETFRIERPRACLVPARRFATEIVSLSVNGLTQDASTYELEPDTGLIYRLSSDERCKWCKSKIVVVYRAGFVTLPAALKLAASKLVLDIYSAGTRDPNLKRERVDGIGEQEFWVPPTKDPAIPQEVADMLSPFVSLYIA